MEELSMFQKLYDVDLTEKVDQKQNLNYVAWAAAWAETKKVYPNATYMIKTFGEEQRPYLFDPELGYMVFTSVTIDDLTHEMWLPVMDGANKAMKNTPYTYKVGRGEKAVEKTVEAATMMDINKALMRCLVKNLAMFGVGLYLYEGEDLPEIAKKLVEKRAEVVSLMKSKMENGIDKAKLYDIVAKHNDGRKNPNSIISVKVCEDIIREVNELKK